MESIYSSEEIRTFVREIVNVYNCPLNPGIKGVEDFLSVARMKGMKELADKVSPIIFELNRTRPWMLGSYEEEMILIKLNTPPQST